jgi:hypothetical protein
MCEKMQKFGENLTKNFGIAFRVPNNSAKYFYPSQQIFGNILVKLEKFDKCKHLIVKTYSFHKGMKDTIERICQPFGQETHTPSLSFFLGNE